LDRQQDGSIIQPFVPLHSNNQRKYLLFAKKFNNLYGKSSGTLVVVCNDSILAQLADSGLSQEDVCILFPDGDVLYRSDEKNKFNFTKEQLARILNENTGYINPSDSHTAFAFGTLENLDWKVVSKVSLASFYSVYNQNRTFLFYVLTIVLFAAAALVYIAERIFVRPLIHLAHSMSETPESGIKFQNTCPNRQDEIGILYRCFDKMLQHIQTLIEEKYKSEIRYLKSCLQNLMSQINAHFLFNTLENINSSAEIEHNRKIVVMSKSLGDILRYSIDYETDEVPLYKEIEQTQKYINIQEIKFGHPIQFKLDVEEGLMEHTVMKFLLQPIVENAIEHGLSGLPENELVLRAYHCDDILYVCVLNNGRRIPEDRLSEIHQKINHWEKVSEDQRHMNIGLSNINQRLQLLYTDKYRLCIQNQEVKGVAVQVTMPYHKP